MQCLNSQRSVTCSVWLSVYANLTALWISLQTHEQELGQEWTQEMPLCPEVTVRRIHVWSHPHFICGQRGTLLWSLWLTSWDRKKRSVHKIRTLIIASFFCCIYACDFCHSWMCMYFLSPLVGFSSVVHPKMSWKLSMNLSNFAPFQSMPLANYLSGLSFVADGDCEPNKVEAAVFVSVVRSGW